MAVAEVGPYMLLYEIGKRKGGAEGGRRWTRRSVQRSVRRRIEVTQM
jgi:hypothetical protein